MNVETLSEITYVVVTKDSVFTAQTDISASVSNNTTVSISLTNMRSLL